MRNLSAIYPGKVTIDGNNPDGTFKNETTPDVSDDGTPNDEKWAQDMWGFFAHILNKVSVSPNGVQENEATSQIYDALESVARTLWTATETAKGTAFLRKRIICSNGTDASHDIDTTAGNFKFADGTGAANIGAFTKRIDATWAAGTGNGGMNDAESVGNNTTYHYFAISNAAGTIVDFGFDTSITAANLVADTAVIAALGAGAKYERQCSVITDGSANIIGFFQVGTRFVLKDRVLLTDNSPGTAGKLVAMTTPLGIEVLGNFMATAYSSSAHYLIVTAEEETNSAATSTNLTVAVNTGVEPRGTPHFETKTNTSSQIRYRCSAATVTSFRIWTLGWEDYQLE